MVEAWTVEDMTHGEAYLNGCTFFLLGVKKESIHVV